MRLAWVTDLHLNHVSLPAWQRWVDAVLALHANGVVITGDISEADDVVFQLGRMIEALELPLYFVLGNHDFYQSSIAQTRQHVIAASHESPVLQYLTDCGPIPLADDVYLIGEDGWGDATIGDYENTPIRLNDFALIEDFTNADSGHWKSMLIEQGVLSAARLAAKIKSLPIDAKQVLVATHVPPFRESCWYEGKTTDDNWAPFFVCGAIGAALKDACQSRPNCQFTVLCGHTHHDGVAKMQENLIVYTGAVAYGAPEIEATINVENQAIQIARFPRL